MKNKLVFIGVASIVLGIGSYFATQYVLAKKITFSIINKKVRSLSVNELLIDIVVAIKNTTQVKIDIAKIKIYVYVNRVHVSDIIKNTPIELLPNTETTTDLQIAINPKEFINNLSQLVDIKGSVNDIPIKIKAIVSISKYGIDFPVPIVINKTVGQLLS